MVYLDNKFYNLCNKILTSITLLPAHYVISHITCLCYNTSLVYTNGIWLLYVDLILLNGIVGWLPQVYFWAYYWGKSLNTITVVC